MSLKRKLADALRGNLVVEMWYDEEGREFRCLASRGREDAIQAHTAGGRTPEAALDAAVSGVEIGPTPIKTYAAPEISEARPPRAGPIDVAAAQARVDAGESLSDVATALGVSRATLYHRLRKAGGQ